MHGKSRRKRDSEKQDIAKEEGERAARKTRKWFSLVILLPPVVECFHQIKKYVSGLFRIANSGMRTIQKTNERDIQSQFQF